MHCPYCSVEYSSENICFCLPSAQSDFEHRLAPDRESQVSDHAALVADPIWFEMAVQPLAMYGLA